MRYEKVAALLLSPLIATVAGCAGQTTGEDVGGSGSCAFVVRYHNETYEAVTVEVAPPEGAPLGTARLPGCNDTDDPDEPPGEDLSVARFPGVPPKEVIVWVGHPDEVLVANPEKPLPTEVERLLDAPECQQRDARLRLSGPWLGIIGPGEQTELDMVPPYQIDLRVEDASAPGYEGALLSVHVRRALEEGLTREDVKASLWEGGTVDAVTECRGGKYVARSLQAFPPG